jgi:hypothetical protein
MEVFLVQALSFCVTELHCPNSLGVLYQSSGYNQNLVVQPMPSFFEIQHLHTYNFKHSTSRELPEVRCQFNFHTEEIYFKVVGFDDKTMICNATCP